MPPAADDCPSCHELAEIEAGRDPLAVARLGAGYVRLNHCQHYVGSTFYVATTCVAEVHQLDPSERATHLMEMAAVSGAVHDEFGARKMNVESLGNGVPHLHWWLTPRPHDDRRPGGPIWEDLDFLRDLWTGAARPAPDVADQLRRRLLAALGRHDLPIEATFI